MTDSNTHARYTAAEHAAQEAREQAETSNRLLEEAEKAAEVAYASLVTEQKENHMTNNDNNNNEDNLIGLNEFIQDDIELDWGVDEDERPFPDSDEAIRALQDDVEDMEVEIARLRAELKTSNAERDEARREVCEITLPCAGSQKGYAKGRGWDCYKNQETK